MRKIIFILLKIVVALAMFGYVVFTRHFQDLRGVFNHDKYFRTETLYAVIHHDDIYRQCTHREVDTYHRDTLGWENTGFAYNIYVKDGKVYLMHDLDGVGAATRSYNSKSISICFHSADRDKLSTKLCLIVTLKFLMYYYGIPKENIKGHCDLNNDTKCPDYDITQLTQWL